LLRIGRESKYFHPSLTTGPLGLAGPVNRGMPDGPPDFTCHDHRAAKATGRASMVRPRLTHLVRSPRPGIRPARPGRPLPHPARRAAVRRSSGVPHRRDENSAAPSPGTGRNRCRWRRRRTGPERFRALCQSVQPWMETSRGSILKKSAVDSLMVGCRPLRFALPRLVVLMVTATHFEWEDGFQHFCPIRKTTC